jgi:8-oxo-dGTP pyrophosphatase MutT (NUDIX family)
MPAITSEREICVTEPSAGGLAQGQIRFVPEDVFALAKAKLNLGPVENALDERGLPSRGDHSSPALHSPLPPRGGYRAAAVLIGLVAHADEVSVILTTRASTLKVHSGQIAFPGGKIETEDPDPAAAAMREAWEEIGLEGHYVELIGYLDPYLTGSGFLIQPVVARVEPAFGLKINPEEVEDAFEVPLSFLMNAEHHELHSGEADGIFRRFYAMPYGERLIWGATAGILRNLYERLYL